MYRKWSRDIHFAWISSKCGSRSIILSRIRSRYIRRSWWVSWSFLYRSSIFSFESSSPADASNSRCSDKARALKILNYSNTLTLLKYTLRHVGWGAEDLSLQWLRSVFHFLLLRNIIIFSLDGYGCPKDSYDCMNGKCVATDLKCDGEDHCGDNSDETYGCIGMYTWYQ